jgi:hypothetical protein
MGVMPIIDVWTGTIRADNYEPVPRDHYWVTGTVHKADLDTGRPETVVITTTNTIKDMHRAVYLLDDGTSVRPHYVAGWASASSRSEITTQADRVYLHPFPLSGGTRPDSGQPIDMSGWALGPRRCYHVKIRKES